MAYDQDTKSCGQLFFLVAASYGDHLRSGAIARFSNYERDHNARNKGGFIGYL